MSNWYQNNHQKHSNPAGLRFESIFWGVKLFLQIPLMDLKLFLGQYENYLDLYSINKELRHRL